MITRLLAGGEAVIGLATAAAASLPGSSPQPYLNELLLAGFLGLLPTAYSLAAGLLARVTSEAPRFGFDGDVALANDP